MKEHPLLFNAAMVKAILGGHKTQTRRVVTRRNSDFGQMPRTHLIDFDHAHADRGFPTTDDGELVQFGRASADQYRFHYLHVPFAHPSDGWQSEDRSQDARFRCYSRVEPGDVIWVKETWWTYPGTITDRMLREGADTWPMVDRGGCEYDADFAADGDTDHLRGLGWVRKPPIFMPRWASRIQLRVKSVRVERLQSITNKDSRSEGIQEDILPACGDHPDLVCYVTLKDDNRAYPKPRDAFSASWDMVYGNKEGHSWGANPWVWVYDFERIREVQP